MSTEQLPLADYQPRVCAYLDILGFSDLVARIPSEPERFTDLLGVLREFQTLSRNYGDGGYYGREVTAFSDSVVVSCPVHKENAAKVLCQDVVWLIRSLLKRGIIVRGGVAVGRMYHHQNVVLGEAMIEAHRLEQTVAIYPRVVVQDAVNYAERLWFPSEPPHCFTSHARPSIAVDHDGISFLDAFSVEFHMAPFLDSSTDFFSQTRVHLVRLRDEARDARVPGPLVKVNWLVNQFNKALASVKETQRPLKEKSLSLDILHPAAREDFSQLDPIESNGWPRLPLSRAVERSRLSFVGPEHPKSDDECRKDYFESALKLAGAKLTGD